VTKESFTLEKRKHWENRLWELLRPISINDLLVLSWSIEAFRDGRTKAARRFIELPGTPDDYQMSGKYFIPPWHIDAVINEKCRLLLIDKKKITSSKLRSWSEIATLFNTYARLSNVESTMDFSPSGIIAAMQRIFWPQYDWQIGFENSQRLGRAWYVYGAPEAKSAFKAKHGIDLDTFLKSLFAVYAATDDSPVAQIVDVPEMGLSRDLIYRSCRVIGRYIHDHAKHSLDIYKKNVPREFNRSSIKEFPIVFVQENQHSIAVTPSRSLLMRRITDGLYYDIVGDDDAKRSTGERFEALCIKMTNHYLGPYCEVEDERPTSYGRSADIKIFDTNKSHGLIIECKARRLPHRVLTSADPWTSCQKDFDDIVKGIVQIWRSHAALSLPNPTQVVGIVVMYDPWTLLSGTFMQNLFYRAKILAEAIGIPEKSKIQIAFSSIFDFERCISGHHISTICNTVIASSLDNVGGNDLYSLLRTPGTQGVGLQRFDFGQIAQESMPWWRFENEQP